MSGGYDSRPPEAPPRLGRYSTLRRLGTGGMAEVYLARSRGAEGTDKLLVVKRILPAFAANARFRAMFVDEARVALRLNHPNVVQVYGFESDGPSLLLVMEFVDGPDLAALAQAAYARGERVPPGLAAWIAREVSRGLHYAHERRDESGEPLEIVHRDVSPGNVLLSHDGVVKLGDFGIAKARLVSGEEEGAIKGKFAYMSPEQARVESVDRRADVYSLGVVLGELLAGRPLFDDTPAGAELLPRLRRGEVPDIHAIAPHAPEPLRAIVAKMTASHRADRYQTAREVGLGLTRFLRTLEGDWDAAALEQYLLSHFTRALLPEPAGDDSRDPRHNPDAATAVRGRPRLEPPTNSRSGPSGLDRSVLVRERVSAAVVVTRIVAPTASVVTVDTRPLIDLVKSLAFKADATLERSDDGYFTMVVGIVAPRDDLMPRAGQLALDIVEAAQALATDQGSDTAASVAVGIARGVTAVARGSSGSLMGFEVVDEAAALATSLAGMAMPGEILVSGALYRIIRREFVLSEHGARGSGNAPRVWRLERTKTRAEREREVGAAHVFLVGRNAELARLREAMTRVRSRKKGEGLVVVGEVGIGKSALLAAFAAEYEAEGTVLRVPVAFGGAEGAYRCLSQVVCELLGVPDDLLDDGAALEAAVDRAVQIAAIPSQGSQRAARRALRVAMGLDRDDAGSESGTAREIVLVMRRLLLARSLLGSLAFVVDGLEQADRHSRAVLEELLRKPPPGPVLTVLAVRDTDELSRELRDVASLRLGPLAEEARGELLAKRLGADEVGRDLLEEVSAVAGGNPLMILEVIEALGDRNRVEVHANELGSRVVLSAAREGELPLPATLEEVLAARIDALPPEARTLARWCALIDGELPVDLLEALGGDDAGRAIGRLMADGILVRARGRRDVVTLAHAALAKVARSSIDPTQIAGMHARVATLLERRPEARGQGAFMVARHREAAGAIRPAARAYLECASALRAASQNRESLEAYVRVLELTHDATDPEGYSLRFAAHLGREEIARNAGRTRARRMEILAMRAIAVDSKDPRLIARALARQARYKLETGLGSGVERDVSSATRAARRAGELRTEAEAKRVLAVYLGNRGRYSEGIYAANEALAALETRSALAPPPGGSADDGVRAARTVRIEVLIAKGALLRQTGEIAGAIEVYAEAHALLSRHGPRRLLAHVLNNLGTACFSRGDYGDALRLYLGSIAIHRENGQRDRLGLALSNAGQTYAALGQSDRALAFLRKSIEVFESTGAKSSGSADAHVALAELHSAQGNTQLALAELERARASAEASGSRYDLVRLKLGEATVALARSEYRAARSSAEEAERVGTDAGIVVLALHARALAAEASACAGDRGAARRFLDAVLADPLLAEPQRLERAELVVAACERTLRSLGDSIDSEALIAFRLSRAHRPMPAPTVGGGT